MIFFDFQEKFVSWIDKHLASVLLYEFKHFGAELNFLRFSLLELGR